MNPFQTAIESLASQAKNAPTPLEAMQYAQAALNLAHAMNIVQSLK